jgi:hypothetical protein
MPGAIIVAQAHAQRFYRTHTTDLDPRHEEVTFLTPGLPAVSLTELIGLREIRFEAVSSEKLVGKARTSALPAEDVELWKRFPKVTYGHLTYRRSERMFAKTMCGLQLQLAARLHTS